MHGDFAFGHLLNLLHIRLEHQATGRKLDDVIAAGTPTSQYLLEEWMALWTWAEVFANQGIADTESVKKI